jgi:hypothetical protein
MTARTLPHFLIAGAARSGTTSLYHWLRQHPDVFMPANKEPSYFVHKYGVADWDAYLKLFDAGKSKKVIGEASTPYMSAPESPAWIRRVLGDIRIIILLRNPIERAWSLYCWMVMEGYERLPSLEQALVEEEQRFSDPSFHDHNPQYFWNYMYYRSGLYCHQVEKYLHLFGRDRVRVYLFDDLAERAAEVYSDACRFLGVDPSFEPTLVAQNASKAPRFTGVQFRLRRLRRALSSRRGSASALQRSMASALMAANVRCGRQNGLRPATVEGLKARYADDVRRLEGVIGRQCAHWIHGSYVHHGRA